MNIKYDFDTIHDRKNTNSVKYDLHRKLGKREDLIPMWIADMDFRVPIEVEEALIKCARHGIFGYSETGESYWEAVRDWFGGGFGYTPERKYLVMSPGVVFAVGLAIRAFTKKGDGVLIQRPVYHPFAEIITAADRRVVNNPLTYVKEGQASPAARSPLSNNGGYHIDIEDFEQKIIANNIKLFILCSPHNPVGRVWTKDELEIMGDICVKHNCLVLSDEIHCDFVYPPHKHTVFSMIKPAFAQNSIICTAPSKTFNLPGLQASNIFIAEPRIRERFIKEFCASGYSQLNTMGLAACENAYRYGRNWLDQLLVYLNDNMKLVYEFGERTGIKPLPLEGTYLTWLDFSPLGLDDRGVDELVADKAGLWLSRGITFGDPEGTGFQRMNIACPRPILERALTQLERSM